MSTTIDQKVVEMRFDNQHFEKNVSSTMSALDKLKQKLHLDGATKGLENVNSAAKNVNVNGLGSAVETVSAKFSAMQVVGVTALANITNSAVNAGKRMLSALTIDPIKTGFQEYETQINAVQTILANTSSKGTTIDDVNRALEELNKYADMTIYNFTEMTRNIGTFTAAGIDLDTSVNAIQGIANLAAVSGSTSQQASTAMYQLSQALASGTVKLMDWNSVVNAGMGGEVFQNALKETSEALGTGAEAAVKAEGSFRESLRTGWLTSEVLTETLKKFTSSGANEYVAKYTGLSVDAVEAALASAEAQYGEADAIKYASEALAEKSGKNKDEIAEMLTFAKTATDAATKVKTFTQLWDVLKESAQSGWSQTWKLIVGDFEEAKNLLTPLADTLTGFINKMSDARNRVLQIALDFTSPWTTMMDKLGKVKKVADEVGKVTDKLEYFQDIVNKVWRGDYNNWGDNPDRFELLEKAGYDHRVVQDLVNKGYQYELTVEDIEASHKKFGLTMETTTKETKEATVAFEKLSDEQLKNAGLTDDEISLYRAMETEASRLGMTVSELAEEMSNNNGRDMLIDSFKNLGGVIVDVGKAIKSAWTNIFNPPSTEVLGIRLYGVIKSLKDFTESLRLTDEKTGELNETGLKFQRVFKGIFAAIDIVLTVLGGPMKIVLKGVTQLLGYFGLGVLDVAAFLGDGLVKVRDFIDGMFDFTKVIEAVSKPIKSLIETFRKWIVSLRDSENLPQDIAKGIMSGLDAAANAVKNFVKKIPEYIKKIPELFSSMFDGSKELPEWTRYFKVAVQTVTELGKMIRERIRKFMSRSEFAGISGDSISGLVQGFREGASKVWNSAVTMVTTLVQKVKDFLGIHSPSTVFAAIGGFIIAGLIAGLQNGIPDSLGAIKDVFQPMLDWIKGIDLGAVFAGFIGVGSMVTIYKAVEAVKAFSSPFESLGGLLETTDGILKKIEKPIKNVVNGFAKMEKAVAFNLRMDGIKTLAISIAILAASVAVLSFIKPAKLWNAVAVVAALAVIVAALAFAMDKLSSASVGIDKNGLNIKGLSSGLTGIGIALVLLAVTVKMLGSLDPDQAKQGFLGLAGLVVAIGLVFTAFGLFVKGKTAQNIDKFGKTMSKMAIALLLMTFVIKIIGGMDQNVLIQGGIVIAAFSVLMVGLMAATRLISGGKNVGKIGGTLLKIAAAIGVMAIVAKILGDMHEEDLIQGGLAILAFSGIMVGLMAATKLIGGNKKVNTIGGTLLKIAVAIGLMALVTKMLGGMDPEDLIQGGLAITAFSGIIVGLMAATRLIGDGKNIKKIGGAILGISGAIAIMALTAFMLSMISWEGFAKGATMITIFAGIVVGLMAATKLISAGGNVEKIGNTLIAVAGAIGILALIAVILGFVPIENLMRGVAVVGVLSLIMTMLIVATGLAKNCMGNIIALTAAIAVMSGAVYLLSLIPAESAMTSALILAGLMTVVAGVLMIIKDAGKNWKDALISVGLLTALCIPLLAFVGILALMQNIQNATNNAIALSTLLLTLSVVLAVLTVIGPFATAAYPAMLALAALVGVITAILVALGALSKIPGFKEIVGDGGETLALIGRAIGAFVGSIVAGFVTEVLTILPALGLALSGFMAGAQPFIAGIKMVDTSVLTGVGIMSAAIIALTAADLMAGIASLGGIGLVDLGKQLSDFMRAALPFVATAALITPEMMAGVKALAETILILTAADLLDGLNLFGSSSLENFATQLPLLGQGLSAFATSLGAFNEEQLTTVNLAANAVKTLAQASSEIPNTGGLLGMLVGENDLSTFASQFPILGSGLANFLSNVGTFTDEQVATVNCAAQAIKALAQASSEIPNSGGLLGQIVGENDLGTFAAQFPVLGTGLRGFLDNVGEFSDAQVATVDCAAKAIKTLAEASSQIPNAGGWLAQIVGDNELGTFAEQFPSLGTGLRGFLDNIGTLDDTANGTITAAANAVSTLATAASSIPNEGGWISKLVGENNLGTFANNFPALGTALRGFIDNIGTFTDAQVSTVYATVSAVNALSKLADSDLSGASKHLSDFGNDLPDFSSDVAYFCTNMPSKVSMTSAVDNLNKLLSAVENVGNANSGCLSTFADNLKKVGKNAVDRFVEAFTSSSAKTNMKDAAKKFAEQAVDGIEAKEEAIRKAGKSAAKEAVDGVETQEDEMKSAGKDLGKGLVNGIKDKWNAAYNAGYTLGQMAVQGEKDGQESNSPSKLTTLAGKWLGEGLIIGMEQMGRKVYSAGSDLGKNATKTISSTISRISDMVSTDIDSQPTIRPVLDLSDVKSGAGTIQNLLGKGGSVGVNTNVSAISSMMNQRIQNGTNSDIISAIDRLRKDLQNVGGNTTNNINGVTYDDGSNINTAIETIIREITIAGRV